MAKIYLKRMLSSLKTLQLLLKLHHFQIVIVTLLMIIIGLILKDDWTDSWQKNTLHTHNTRKLAVDIGILLFLFSLFISTSTMSLMPNNPSDFCVNFWDFISQ